MLGILELKNGRVSSPPVPLRVEGKDRGEEGEAGDEDEDEDEDE